MRVPTLPQPPTSNLKSLTSSLSPMPVMNIGAISPQALQIALADLRRGQTTIAGAGPAGGRPRRSFPSRKRWLRKFPARPRLRLAPRFGGCRRSIRSFRRGRVCHQMVRDTGTSGKREAGGSGSGARGQFTAWRDDCDGRGRFPFNCLLRCATKLWNPFRN